MPTVIKPRFCRSCANQGTFPNGEPGCAKFNIKVDIDKDYCSWHSWNQDLINCDLCHTPTKSNELSCWITARDDTEYIVCGNCLKIIGSCATCYYQNICGFKSDHSEPQIVMKTVQQGMMRMQTQVKNPNLIEKHCVNCRCSYDTQGSCQKDDNGVNCVNWKMREPG